MYISQRIWTYEYMDETITTTKVLNISIISKMFLVFYAFFWYVCFLIRVLSMRSILLTYLKVYSTASFTTDAMLY